MRRAALAASALALALSACGGEEPSAAERPAAAGAPSSIRPDDGPWSDDPAGSVWEACAWIPSGDGADAWVFDLAAERVERAAGQTSPRSWLAAQARTTWLRTLGLPEAALGTVIAVQDPLRYSVCTPKISEADLVRALAAKGLVEMALPEGARGFRQPDGERPAAVLLDGRLLLPNYEDDVVSAVIAVRRGGKPSLQSTSGVRAACAAAPKGMPAEIEAGKVFRRRPDLPPPPLASVGVISMGARRREVRTVTAASEAERDEFRCYLERLVPHRIDAHPDDVILIAVRGPVLRFTADTRHNADGLAARRAAQEALEQLTSALDQFRGRRGALPTEAEGLGALAGEAEVLDALLGAVPPDPWGRPFAYQPAHPKRPDGFVLRSLGPDGEVDTEDDVLPEPRDR